MIPCASASHALFFDQMPLAGQPPPQHARDDLAEQRLQMIYDEGSMMGSVTQKVLVHSRIPVVVVVYR